MAETIRIKLPDGSEKQVPRGTTALEIARQISPRGGELTVELKGDRVAIGGKVAPYLEGTIHV